MKRIVSSVIVLFAAVPLTVALSACPKKAGGDDDKGGGTTSSSSSGSGPVAKVNGEELSRSEFDKQMERTRARFQRAGRQIAPALESRLKENLIRKMIEEELIAQKAKGEGISLEQTEIDAKLTEHKGRFGSDKAFQSFLERTSQSEADVKSDLEKNLLRDKLFAKLLAGSEPTEDDAKKYYEENKDKYKQKEQIKASHILFKIDKTTPEAEKKKKLADAKKVYAEAKKAGANFEELAKKHSEGPTAQRGGDLGTFSRGRMVPQFEDAAFAAKPGDVIGPVETSFGYHIIKVYEKTPESQKTYDEVKDSILTSLKARQKSKATRELLDKLKADAKIEILEPGVSLEPKKPVTVDGKPLGLDAVQGVQPGAPGTENPDAPDDKPAEGAKPEDAAKEPAPAPSAK